MDQVTFNSPTHALLAKKLLQKTTRKLVIVDYGCGEGELLHYLPKARIKEYRGFDVSESAILIAKKKWKAKNVAFAVIDRKHLPRLGKQKSTDILILIGAVQYMSTVDLAHVLKEAAIVLNSQGELLISCTTDHKVYSWFNIYRLFLSHYSVNRKKLINRIERNKLKVHESFERGLVLTPFFSNIFIFFFDALDKIVFRTKGELGPIGRKMRKIWSPVMNREFQLKIDFGYTLFIVASK